MCKRQKNPHMNNTIINKNGWKVLKTDKTL